MCLVADLLAGVDAIRLPLDHLQLAPEQATLNTLANACDVSGNSEKFGRNNNQS
jgi:hypothetical protein